MIKMHDKLQSIITILNNKGYLFRSSYTSDSIILEAIKVSDESESVHTTLNRSIVTDDNVLTLSSMKTFIESLLDNDLITNEEASGLIMEGVK